MYRDARISRVKLRDTLNAGGGDSRIRTPSYSAAQPWWVPNQPHEAHACGGLNKLPITDRLYRPQRKVAALYWYCSRLVFVIKWVTPEALGLSVLCSNSRLCNSTYEIEVWHYPRRWLHISNGVDDVV
jgi:hypothetical protein